MTMWDYKVKQVRTLPRHTFQGMTVTPVITKDETEKLVAYHIHLRKGLKIPPSYHKKAQEIIWILRGRGIAHLNGRNVRVKKGDVILVRPRTWHSFLTQRNMLEVLAVTTPRVDSKTDLYHE